VFYSSFITKRDHRGRDRMVVVFTISTYHYYSCAFESRPWRGVLDTTVCDSLSAIQHYVIKLSVTCDRSVVISGYFGFLHQ